MTKRPTIWIPLLAALLTGLQLLQPVDSFAFHVTIPSSIASQQRCWLISSKPTKCRQNNPTLFSSNPPFEDNDTPRSPLRKVTGFSLTAIRSTLRTATGFSLTTLRATLRAATGISLSQQLTSLVAFFTGILPAGVRYFLQPLLILYYAPMMIVRYYLVGPNRAYVEESKAGHERVVEGWRKAVEAAERAQEGGYWPVHLNEDGSITASLPPDPDHMLDVTDGIEKSVELEPELSQSAL